MIMGDAASFIGAFSSNVGRWTYEIMAFHQFPPHYYDVDNDVYFTDKIRKGGNIL